VWSTPLSQEEKLLALNDEDFLVELRKAFTAPAQRVTQLGVDMERLLPILPSLTTQPKPPAIERLIGKRASFPLRVTHATEYVRQRIALIGYFALRFEYKSFTGTLLTQFILWQVKESI
jgi:2-polyprenyl-6-methoxyphenol hydroxylase-like FAD-dependent oxidoreductase